MTKPAIRHIVRAIFDFRVTFGGTRHLLV